MCLKPTAHFISNLQTPETLSGGCCRLYLSAIPISSFAVKALNLFWCLPSHILRGSGPPSPSPAQRRWNRLRQSFRFQFPFLMISLSKSCDIPWPMRGWGSLTGSSWKDFPCFYKWVFKEGGHSYPGLGYCL